MRNDSGSKWIPGQRETRNVVSLPPGEKIRTRNLPNTNTLRYGRVGVSIEDNIQMNLQTRGMKF